MLAELTFRRRPPHWPDGSPIDGIRLLALLPTDWRMDLRQATGDIVIRVYARDTTAADMRGQVAAALADPAVRHWELLACDLLVDGRHEYKG
jgi:hypothetical protein